MDFNRTKRKRICGFPYINVLFFVVIVVRGGGGDENISFT
jgi:hypothetical protein